MINDFDAEVKSKLDADEKIENCFKIRNKNMLKKSTDISVGSGAFIASGDYSFFYKFIITNKRVFVGNLNNCNQTISYEIYNRDDIKVLVDEGKDKKLTLSIIYYICGLLPIALFGGFLFHGNFVSKNLTGCILVALSVIVIAFALYKLIKISDKSKLSAIISIKDNKKLYGIFNTENDLSTLKKLQ